jgi:LPS export ABC transporter protein LptC
MRLRTLLITLPMLAAGLAACGGDSSESPEVLSPDDLPPVDATFGVTHVMTARGVRSAILEADTAYNLENGRRWDMRGVHIQFFTETGAESGVLTSLKGEYTPNTGSFIARDDVVLITQSEKGERRLETEELFYDVETEQVWSDSTFLLNEGGTVYRGKSFRSDVGGANWTAVGLETEEVSAGGAEITF